MNASLFLTLKMAHLTLSPEDFYKALPLNYRVALFHFIRTDKTIQKALADMNLVFRHGGEICTQTPKYFRLMPLCPYCPGGASLKQTSLNEKGSPFPPQ